MGMKGISIRGPATEVNVVRYINLFLLAAILAVLALLVREVITRPPSPHVLAGRAGLSGGSATTGRGFSEYAVIGTSGILGVKTALSPMRSGTAMGAAAGSAPAGTASGAGATLLGTVLGTGGRDFAVFKDKTTGKEEVIRKGAMVFNIGRLVAVEKYRALVQSGGRNLVFNMDLSEKERAMGQAPLQTGLENLVAPRSRGMGPGFNPFTGRKVKHLAKPLGKGRWLVDRRALDNAIKDSSRVLSDARFIPYREGGVVKGFMLSQVRPYGVFYEMGMRSGDIILRVNDYAIDAPEKAVSLMKGLRGETDVKVDILRRGRAETFKYEIR